MRWIIALLVVGLIGWWGYDKFVAADTSKGKGAPAVLVTAAPVTRQDVPIALSLVGNVIAYETVSIKSRLDSLVTDVRFKDGDYVEQGQVLFMLDDRNINAQLKEQEANVAKERAQLQNLRLQYDRARTLNEKKFVAQAQVDQTKAAYNSQLAVIEAAQAAMENTRVLLSYTTIRAPISGRAGTINVTKGNNVKANDTQALVTINQVSPIRAQFAIPERYYEQVKAALTASIPVTASRQGVAGTSQGTLEYIDNTIDPSTGAFTARAIFSNENEALWPGMFATIAIALGREAGALTVPAVAVQGDEGKHFVFKLAEGKAIKTPVDVARTLGETAIISKGLSEGEQVLTDGLLRVTDGAAVEISKPKTEAPKEDAPKQ